MIYTEQNPHPDLEFVERRDNGETWFRCLKCGQYMHLLHHFGWRCPFCYDNGGKNNE